MERADIWVSGIGFYTLFIKEKGNTRGACWEISEFSSLGDGPAG